MAYGRFLSNAGRDTGLNPRLIAAIIHKESSGNPWATRYEKNFESKYLRNKTKKTAGGFVPDGPPTFATELKDRATSWGLMQIMGQTARENGYNLQYLANLLDPGINIHYGSIILHRFVEQTQSIKEALLRWNGGANTRYPDHIISILEGGEADYLLHG